MATVFISHAGADTVWAEQIHAWLKADGHNVFFDRDRNDGVIPGEKWEVRLYQELRQADAVICVVSADYLKSVWCAAEIGAARALGTELLPMRISGEEQHPVLSPFHAVDAASDADDARDRVRARLNEIDGSGGWGWPDDKSPYPGLRPFELGEHRVFFGRTREITQIAERLRSPDRAAPAVLTVVGPSGCGKSSLVRAGLLPRIWGEPNWLTVPPFLPGTDPVGSLTRAIATVVHDHNLSFDAKCLRSEMDGDGLSSVATDLLIAAGAGNQCKLLVVIDQFEELITQTPQSERARFAEMLAPSLGGSVQALATLRPEFLDAVSKDGDLVRLPLRVQQIRPLDADALRSVIEKPAKVAGLQLEEDLVSRLVADTGSGDALPLLAFTLEQLAQGAKRGDQLTNERYVSIGGVQGALARQADAALEEACAKTGVTREPVISALLDLVTIDEEGRPTKRRVAYDEFSALIADELEPFVTRRLLATEAVGERTFVSVAHEAFLVNWAPLADEIEAKVTALRARRVVENAASDWEAGGRDPGSLLVGRQLTKATVDIGAEIKAAESVEPQENRHRIHCSGRGSLITRVDLNETGRSFLEASLRSARRRRLRIITQMAAAITLLALVAVLAIWRSVDATNARDQAQLATAQAQDSAKRAIASRLVNEAGDIFGRTRGGGDVQGFHKLIAAAALAPDIAADELYNTVRTHSATVKIIDVGSAVLSTAYSPDGKRMAGAVGDGTVRLWDADSGRPLAAPMTGHDGMVMAVAFSPDGKVLASTSGDGTVRLWNGVNGEPLGAPLSGHTDQVNGVAFSPDGKVLASVSGDGTIRLWDVATGKPNGAPLTSQTDDVSSVSFSPDGKLLATGGYDGTVRLWDLVARRQVGDQMTANPRAVNSIAFSPDGARLASAGDDHCVRLWDVATRNQIGEPLTAHIGALMDVKFRPGGHQLAAADFSDTVQLWNVDTGRAETALTGHTGAVGGIAFSPDGKRLVSGSYDGTARVWDIDPADDLGRPLLGHNGRVTSVAFSPDGKLLASGGEDKTVRLWDVVAGAAGATLAGPAGEVNAVAFSPRGDRLAAGCADGTVWLWDPGTGKQLGAPLTGHGREVSDIAFSPDGNRLATSSYDGTARVWDVQSRQPVSPPLTAGTGRAVNSVSFSPDGKLLASAGDDQMLRIWNVETGKQGGDGLHGPTGALLDVKFSPDGRLLATGNWASSVQLWDVGTRQPVGAALADQSQPVGAIAFSPDGKRLESGSWDGTVRIWNVDTRQPAGRVSMGEDISVTGVAFSPDGREIADAGSDGSVRIWPATASPDMLCNKLTANMTPEQWRDWISPDLPYEEVCTDL